VFTIEDGHITAFREFLDSHLAAAACEAGMQG
jgi:ketosteroid isomerase-like protein